MPGSRSGSSLHPGAGVLFSLNCRLTADHRDFNLPVTHLRWCVAVCYLFLLFHVASGEHPLPDVLVLLWTDGWVSAVDMLKCVLCTRARLSLGEGLRDTVVHGILRKVAGW